MLARLSSHESVFFSRQILNAIEYMTLKVLGQCACMGTWVSVLKFWNPKHSHGPKSGEQGGWGTTSNRYAIAIVGFLYSGRASERFVLLLYSFQSSRLGLFLWNTKKKIVDIIFPGDSPSSKGLPRALDNGGYPYFTSFLNQRWPADQQHTWIEGQERLQNELCTIKDSLK